ncbi:hypothetical protein TNCT_182711 [Trichonephila clavata]|uniref:Uncharacterized protein n=1 Tax=Trichonephila clavata TaxID=2740835 RepID=A0A8X6H4Q7_TRICU|nr:hypothetical protein TNCT_182711 [Trichonephila clavata]
MLSVIVEERTTTEKQKAMKLEDKQKAVAVAQQQEREFEMEKLRIQLEMQKLSQAPVAISTPEQPHIGFKDALRIALCYGSTRIVDALSFTTARHYVGQGFLIN